MTGPLDQQRNLIVLDQARRILTTSESLEEVKSIRDKAEAVRNYARSAALSLEVQNQAAELKLRAERRAGELLNDLRLRGGNRKCREVSKPRQLRDLGISATQSARWQLEASVPEPVFHQYIRSATEQGKELTAAGLLRVARSGRNGNHTSGDPRVQFTELASVLRSLARQGKRFSCIYADPPWMAISACRRRGGKGQRIAGPLSELPVKALAASDAHLHLWTLPEAICDAMRVLIRWGFRYETFLVWPTTPEGYGPYWRGAHQVLLLGVRGDLPFRDVGLPSYVGTRQESIHHRSPLIRQLIERASPPPYLDLFGTTSLPEWTPMGSAIAYGNSKA